MDICHPFFRRITVGAPVSEIIGNQFYCVLKQDISQTLSLIHIWKDGALCVFMAVIAGAVFVLEKGGIL